MLTVNCSMIQNPQKICLAPIAQKSAYVSKYFSMVTATADPPAKLKSTNKANIEQRFFRSPMLLQFPDTLGTPLPYARARLQ